MAERRGSSRPTGGGKPDGSAAGGSGGSTAHGSSGTAGSGEPRTAHSPELTRIRRQIDALDKRIVALLHERAGLVLQAGRTKERLGRRAIRDLEREREVLLRVAMENDGPLPQADLLAFYRQLMAASRRLEAADRRAAKARAALGFEPERGSDGRSDARSDGQPDVPPDGRPDRPKGR